VTLLLLIDVWPPSLTVAAVPALPGMKALRASGAQSVLELPVGPIDEDTLAIHRQLAHRLPVVNGYSGHAPPHYPLLQLAIGEGDPSALDPWRATGSLIVGRADDEAGARWAGLLARLGARDVATLGGRRYALVPRSSPPAVACADANAMPHDWSGPWMSDAPQRGGETLTLTLRQPGRVCGLRLLQSRRFMGEYPRRLIVEASGDDGLWRTLWEGRTAGLSLAAVLRDAERVPLTIPLAGDGVRHLRLRQAGTSERTWAVAQIEVLGR
jgi:hypothetical protein